MDIESARTTIETYAREAGWQPERMDPPTILALTHPFHSGHMIVDAPFEGIAEVVHRRELWRGSVQEFALVLDAQLKEDEGNFVRVAHQRDGEDYVTYLYQTFAAASKDALEEGLGLMGNRMYVRYEAMLDAIIATFAANHIEVTPERQRLLDVAQVAAALNEVVSMGGGVTQESGAARVTAIRDDKIEVRLRPTRRPMSIAFSNGSATFVTMVAGLGDGSDQATIDDMERNVADLIHGTNVKYGTPTMDDGPLFVLAEQCRDEDAIVETQAIIKRHAAIAMQLHMPELRGKNIEF